MQKDFASALRSEKVAPPPGRLVSRLRTRLVGTLETPPRECIVTVMFIDVVGPQYPRQRAVARRPRLCRSRRGKMSPGVGAA